MDTHFTIIKEKINNPIICYNFPPANIYLYLYFQNFFEKKIVGDTLTLKKHINCNEHVLLCYLEL
jgi:hypothetical protein